MSVFALSPHWVMNESKEVEVVSQAAYLCVGFHDVLSYVSKDFPVSRTYQ